MAATSDARKPRAKTRPMTRADICNVELLTPTEERFLEGDEQLALSDDEIRRIAEVEKLNEVLRGVLRVNPYDSRGTNAARGYISADDDRTHEDGISPIGFALDWQANVSECEGDAVATLLHHLRWNMAEHQKLLDATVTRLRDAKLVGDDQDDTTRWGLREWGAQ